MAEHNRQKAEIREAVNRRLNSLQVKAIEAVESAIEKGDARIALAVLKGTGSLNGDKLPVGSTDPDRIIKNQLASENEQKLLDSLLNLR
ncbi:MAG: hypothetical protein OEM32_02690 [Acidimicrobiia bacterium]|nr:hypothetical protein [Acidimicrobiia bacterium]